MTDSPAPPARRGLALLLVGLVVAGLLGAVAWKSLARKEVPLPLGATASVGGLDVTVELLQCGAAPMPTRNAGGTPIPPQGQFCVATVQARNPGASPEVIASGRQRLLTADGQAHSPAPAVMVPAYAGGPDFTVAAGGNARFTLVFDVAVGTRPTLLHLAVGPDGARTVTFST